MKKLVLAVFAVAALAATPAIAADMPVKAAPAPIAPVVAVWSWTGFYFGGHVGYAWNSSNTYNPAFPPGFFNTANSFIGGGQIGANYQFNRLVVGVQVDGSLGRLTGGLVACPAAGSSCQNVQDGILSATGRIGYAWDRALVYGKGGAAWTKATFKAFTTATGTLVEIAKEQKHGYTWGGGFEYAFWKNVSAFVEYDRFVFRSPVISATTPAGVFAEPAIIRMRTSAVKVGVNVKFP